MEFFYFIFFFLDLRSSMRWHVTISVYHSNGSATSEDLFWKLDALQMFVMDLHWPEPEFAKHLEQRLKLMASDMMEACVKRSAIYRLIMLFLLKTGASCNQFLHLWYLGPKLPLTLKCKSLAGRLISASPCLCAQCSMFSWMPRSSAPSSVFLTKARRYVTILSGSVHTDTSIFTLVGVYMRLMVFIKTSSLCSVGSWELKTRLRTLNYVTLISHLNRYQTGKVPFISFSFFKLAFELN